MSEQTKSSQKSRIQAEFEALPLEEKFASLLNMEVATLSESFNYVVESSSKAFDKMGEVFSDLGSKVETEFKKAQAQASETGGDQPKPEEPKAKKSAPKSTRK
ncbi:MAG: hypothetical protein JO053_14865 [Acidobacteria bacterium]|nr:hypothetical protein [Acidobacteriota bacterium]